MESENPVRRDAWGLGAAVFSFVVGQAFIPRLGIQNDEALFASPIFAPRDGLDLFQFAHTHFALMLMSYLGTLKTLVLLPVVKVFGANVWSVREPMLLAGAAGIWVFYRFLRYAAGERAARIGAVLLAADSVYLLTNCFDWGPVALQHLLLPAGMLLALRFYRERRDGILAAAFFVWGLALWDKALAIWMLSGLTVAAVAIFPREVLGAITRRRVAIAAMAFAAGALPLEIYNAGHRMDTFQGNFSYNTAELPAKARMLLHTGDGSAVMGYLDQADSQTPRPHSPRGALEELSAAIGRLAGNPVRSIFPYGFVLALALAPLARSRALWFALIAMLLAWAQMAVTANAGGSAHHTILLWPLPQMIVAIALANVVPRRIMAVAVAVLCVSSLLVTNQYYVLMARNGGSPGWTDAIWGLKAYLDESRPPAIYCMDWGYFDGLRLLGMGKYPLREGSQGATVPSMALQMIADPRNIFVTHTERFAFFPANDPNLARIAEQSGYRREDVAAIEDSYGRTMFAVYRFQKVPASSPLETRKLP